MDSRSESQLVQSARSGDKAAFEQLYRKYNDRIFNFSKRITGSPEDAGDVTQETFVRAWNALPKLRADETFGVWLHRIALNRSRDTVKKKGREFTLSIDSGATDAEGAPSPLDLVSEEPTPEDSLMSVEDRSAVIRAIDSLSEDHRLVVTLHHLEGMDVEEVSEVLGIPRGTVMSRLSRAREALRRKLSPYVEAGNDEHKQ